MDLKTFEKEIEDFITYGIEYLDDVKYEITNDDEEELFAEITGFDQWQKNWTIPITISWNEKDKIVISSEPDMYELEFSIEGLYMYLFVEAAHQIYRKE